MHQTSSPPHGRNAMTQVRFRVDFAAGCSIGPGKVELLEGIERTGSPRQAARGLKMSYRRAWLLLDQLNHSFAMPVTIATVGGSGGGGAALTPLGTALIRAYRTFDHEVQARARRSLRSPRAPRPHRRLRPGAGRIGSGRRLSRARAADRAE